MGDHHLIRTEAGDKMEITLLLSMLQNFQSIAQA